MFSYLVLAVYILKDTYKPFRYFKMCFRRQS